MSRGALIGGTCRRWRIGIERNTVIEPVGLFIHFMKIFFFTIVNHFIGVLLKGLLK